MQLSPVFLPKVQLAKVAIRTQWSQFFRVSGANGTATSDQDLSLYVIYNEFVPQRMRSDRQWLAWDPNASDPGLWLPDVYNYFSLEVADAQEIQVLAQTPAPFRIAITAANGGGWVYDPLFYIDDDRSFFVTPTAVQAAPTTVRRFAVLARLAAPDSVAQVAKVFSSAAVSHVDLSTQTSGDPAHPTYALTLVSPATVLTRPSTHTAYTFEPFYHPYVSNALINLNRDGIDGLYDPQPGKPGDDLRRQLKSEDKFTPYAPTPWVTTPYPVDDFDFSPRGAYAPYNWELFFHIPFLIATKLADDQQFDLALQWFHYIFNPQEPSSATALEPAPQRFWKVKPFYQLSAADTDAESPVAILSLLLSHDDTDPARLAVREALQDQVEQWRANPFDPDVIARLRPVAYMKAVVMKYLDMLIAWGDSLFAQATRETINEAVQIYVMALKVLGKKPTKLPPKPTSPVAYDDIAGSLDDFSDAVEQIELVLPPVNDDVVLTDADDAPTDALSMIFCVPPNDKLLGYWDTVQDRLTKIRNCLSLTGQPLSLPLFAPPIDPGLLIAARAAGLDIGSVVADVNSPPPLQRYSVLAQRAMELVNEVKSFGGQLLSALEKKDAEALALLRANQEITLLQSQRVVKQDAIKDATLTVSAATAAHASATTKQTYYQDLINAGWLPEENAQMDLLATSGGLQLAGGVLQGISAAIAPVPDTEGGVAGWGGFFSGHLPGGEKLSHVLSLAGSVANIAASAAGTAGQLAGTTAGFKRRAQEWQFQLDLASAEVTQTQAQLDAATERLQQANDDLAAHDVQYQNSIDARDFMRDKYTNEELYDWMSSQLSAVYFQTYQLAYATAKRAERAWQFELADDSTFITFGYWESARQGLLAGERLSLDLKRMEMAYLDKDVREFELTRHIPLTQLDGYALKQLCETGWCLISIPEALFDSDSPGHYLRRIKAVGLTITGTTGPYTPVRCTLTLTSSQVRTGTTTYGTTPDDDLVTSPVAVQAVVTSTGQNDSGLFETNLRDERYLPFERAGAVSQWRLELPMQKPLFDYRTIQDVILHMRYTARDGGDTFRTKVLTTGSPYEIQPWVVAFSVKSAFSDGWFSLLSSTSSTASMTLNLDTDHVPFRAESAVIQHITLVRIQKTISGSPTPSFTLKPLPSGTATSHTLAADSSIGGQYAYTWDYSSQALGDFQLSCDMSSGNAPLAVDDDLYVVVTYTVF